LPTYPIFLTCVFVLRNESSSISEFIKVATDRISSLVSDYEIVIVDNASEDDSVSQLKNLTGERGFPNLQIYALTKEVDWDTASWVGLENALGDFVAVIEPFHDEIVFLPSMLAKAVGGADVVFGANSQKQKEGWVYKVAYGVFNWLYKAFNGINLSNEAPRYRILSKKVINFILQHPQPGLAYRHLPATAGFTRAYFEYSSPPKNTRAKRLRESIDRGARLLVSTTRAPMRIVTSLSLLGAISNLLYSIYVVAVAFLKPDVEPGWISLSLQLSGMFFLISLVLMVLGEYILHMASLSNEGPLYHVAQEFTSARIIRREKLNINDSSQKSRS
jgi:hypothetical protein